MRRVLLLASLLALMVVLAVASVAVADHNLGPCNESGGPGNSDYAQHHIVPVAQDGDLGEADHDGDLMTHNPGSHQGYSFCNPSGS
ncbi:MAG: hypothetical protein ACRDKB_02785 [Actinomycetota bacterium]